MTRKQCLDMAKEQVTGGRAEDYGQPEDNFSFIADLWEAYLKHRRSDSPISAKDVSLLMILMKVARAAVGTKNDSWVDIAGYAACGVSIVGEEELKKYAEKQYGENLTEDNCAFQGFSDIG